MPKRAYYEEETKFHELNNLAGQCVVLSFDEKRGLQSEDVAELLCTFREVIEAAMSEEDYDDFSVHVYSVHNGDDPEFLCYLGNKLLSEEEVQEVYEFLLEDEEDEWDE